MTSNIDFLIFVDYVTYANCLTRVRNHVRRFYGNCRTLKISEMLGYDGEYPPTTPEANFDICTKNREKSVVIKHSIEEHILFNLSICP